MATDILLVSFYYPPFTEVGARRWGFLSRFLAEKGFAITVVTSPLNGPEGTAPAGHERITVHAVPSPSWRPPRIPRLPFIEEWLTWQRPFRKFLEKRIRLEHPRLLVFTGGPFFSFVLAPGLGKRLHIPYWLDFRDPWDLGSHISLRFSAPLIRRLEQRAVRGAWVITDVTPEMAARRRAAFPDLPPERFQVLENGYEGIPVAPRPPSPPGTVLRLGIWGKFSQYQADHPSILVAAVAELAGEIPMEIHHFGAAEAETSLADNAARRGLAHVLHFHGHSEYEAGISLLAGMDVMVVSHRSPLMVGTKVYDAIRINRPILAFCRPGDALARLLRPFRYAFPVTTVKEAAAAFREIVRLRPGCLDPGLDPGPYSRGSQAGKILPLLASLLGPR